MKQNRRKGEGVAGQTTEGQTDECKIVFTHTGCHKEGIKGKHKCYYPNNTGSHWEDEEDVKQKHTWHWKETRNF